MYERGPAAESGWAPLPLQIIWEVLGGNFQAARR